MSIKPPTEVVKNIDHITRLGCSANGNPRFRVTFTDGDDAITQTDAAINYGIENSTFRDVPVVVHLTPAGRIWNLKVAVSA